VQTGHSQDGPHGVVTAEPHLHGRRPVELPHGLLEPEMRWLVFSSAGTRGVQNDTLGFLPMSGTWR